MTMYQQDNKRTTEDTSEYVKATPIKSLTDRHRKLPSRDTEHLLKLSGTYTARDSRVCKQQTNQAQTPLRCLETLGCTM